MQNKIYTYLKNNKTINLLNLLMIIFFMVPYSYSYSNTNEYEDLYWMPNFVFDNVRLFFFYLLLLVFTIGFQLLKKGTFRKMFLIVFSIFSLLCFLYGLIAFVVPTQDFMPGLGNFLMMAIFPITLLLFRNEKKIH